MHPHTHTCPYAHTDTRFTFCATWIFYMHSHSFLWVSRPSLLSTNPFISTHTSNSLSLIHNLLCLHSLLAQKKNVVPLMILFLIWEFWFYFQFKDSQVYYNLRILIFFYDLKILRFISIWGFWFIFNLKILKFIAICGFWCIQVLTRYYNY